MSWVSRFHRLKQYKPPPPDELEPVFISGSKFMHDKIICELSRLYPWADISNVSFSSLKVKFANNYQKILDFMKHNRYDSKIYKHCNIDLLLLQTVHSYLKRNHAITTDLLDKIYTQCSSLLCGYESDISKTIFVLDYRLIYFMTFREHIDELLLYNSAALALIEKMHLFPYIEFVILCDTQLEFDHLTATNGSSDSEAKATALESTLIAHLRIRLQSINQPVKLKPNLDMDRVISIIINAHTMSNSIESDLF
nr:TPA: Guanylate kinase-like protein [Oryctes rhinoceros nudivirus]